MTPLDEAIRMAVRGEYPPGVSEIDGHEFYIRAIDNKNLLQEGETSYFRHSHIGKDDRIFYSIELNDGTYTAKLTRIQFRGPFTRNGFRPIGDHGINVTDAVKVITAAAGVNANFPPHGSRSSSPLQSWTRKAFSMVIGCQQLRRSWIRSGKKWRHSKCVPVNLA